MPIRADLRQHYGAAWRETRALILRRARYACEHCGKPDRARVLAITGKRRDGSGYMLWRVRESSGRWITQSGWPATAADLIVLAEGPSRRGEVGVVLTIAHLNHQPGDDRPENLKALCQWCHLHYDQVHHKQTRCARKDRARPLLA